MFVVNMSIHIHVQTPDGSLLDILRNACDLLSQCNVKLPEVHPFRIPAMSTSTLLLSCLLACLGTFYFSFSHVRNGSLKNKK